MDLALKMGRTVDELLKSVTSADLAEWRAFFRLQNDEYAQEMRDSMMTGDQNNARIVAMFRSLQARQNAHIKQSKNRPDPSDGEV